MRFIKRVELNSPTRPAQFFYSLKLIPFRRLISKRIDIEGTVYNFWLFPSKNKRKYIAAFPVENVNHFLVFEYREISQCYLSTQKEYKLSDFDMEKPIVKMVYSWM